MPNYAAGASSSTDRANVDYTTLNHARTSNGRWSYGFEDDDRRGGSTDQRLDARPRNDHDASQRQSSIDTTTKQPQPQPQREPPSSSSTSAAVVASVSPPARSYLADSLRHQPHRDRQLDQLHQPQYYDQLQLNLYPSSSQSVEYGQSSSATETASTSASNVTRSWSNLSTPPSNPAFTISSQYDQHRQPQQQQQQQQQPPSHQRPATTVSPYMTPSTTTGYPSRTPGNDAGDAITDAIRAKDRRASASFRPMKDNHASLPHILSVTLIDRETYVT